MHPGVRILLRIRKPHRWIMHVQRRLGIARFAMTVASSRVYAATGARDESQVLTIEEGTSDCGSACH